MDQPLIERRQNETAQSVLEKPWCSIAAPDAAQRLNSNTEVGLSPEEAAERLSLNGPNRIETKEHAEWYVVLLRQFLNALILILFVAAALSLAIGEVVDAVAIIAIILLNGLLGFVQEWKAEKALEALEQMLSPHCRVIRNGQEEDIDAAQLVPGDVVVLETGNRIPADLRLVHALDLRIDESALTGESGSVHKQTDPVAASAPIAERFSMAWMGTAVTNGRATGLVVATGMATEFGRIAELTRSVGRDETPLQEKLGALGRQLGVASIFVSVVVALTGWAMGRGPLEMFFTGISLAVAVVPEGLPAVVTLTLALGVRAMVKRKALLRRLQAAETLGSATVICTDKTGTLTENEMTVTRIWLPSGEVQVTGTGYDPAGHFEKDGERIDYKNNADLQALLRCGQVCSHAQVAQRDGEWIPHGEPTEVALQVAAYKAWLDQPDEHRILGEFSFNSTRKRMSVIYDAPDGTIAYVKGAPEVILDRCTAYRKDGQVLALDDAHRAEAEQAYAQLAERGLRTLALAERALPDSRNLNEDEVETNLTLLGIVGIIDPPRPEVTAAIAKAHAAGINIIMITGDAAKTGLAIAGKIGLKADRAVTGAALTQMTDEALINELSGDVTFARTTPDHKMRIVELLQRQGHVVGMTGDGVNDAPALKKADIGIAMGIRGTDVAKGASDMVLTDDNFASIIDAVEEGRRQYENIQKFVRYLLSSNFGEIVAIFLNIVLGGPLILLPVQILWMNLITDGLTAVALGVEPAGRDAMAHPPRPPNEPLLNKSAILMISILGGYIGLATLLLFQFYLDGTPERALMAQTMAFTGIIVFEKMNVLNFRSLSKPMSHIGFLSNPWILVAWSGCLLLQAAAVYTPFLQEALHTVPLGWWDWALIFIVAVPIFLLTEAYKWLQHRSRPKPDSAQV